jgi:hypothetical protein
VYQRWIYRVDPKRVNEFGTSGEMVDQDQNGSPASAPALMSGEDPNGAVVRTSDAAAVAAAATDGVNKSPRSSTSHRPKSKASKKKD